MRFREMKLRKDPGCPVCGENPTVTELIDYQEFCGIPQASAQTDEVPEITVGDLKEKLDELSVLDVREPHEYEVANIGARLIPLSELPERLIELDKDQALRSEEHTSELQSRQYLVCRLLLEKKNN